MTLTFRNVDAALTDAVQTWPYEALVESMERGLIGDWTPILDELRREPWGTVARKVQRWASMASEEPATAFFSLAIEHLRQRTRQPRLATTGGTRDQQALPVAQPVTAGQAQQKMQALDHVPGQRGTFRLRNP